MLKSPKGTVLHSKPTMGKKSSSFFFILLEK